MKKVVISVAIIFNLFLFVPVQASSLVVSNGNLPQLLLSIARSSGLNLVLDKEIQGEVTIVLKDLTPREMLRTIALGQGLSYEELSGVIYIRSDKQARSLRTIHVQYINLELMAKKIALVLEGVGSEKGGESKGGVVINPEQNELTFYATDQEYEKVMQAIRGEDVPPKQIALEAKIISLEKSATEDLGVDWSWSTLPAVKTISDGTKEKQKGKEEVEHDFGSAIRFGKNITGVPYEIGFAARLNALITKGKANVLAKPNITTLQGKEAVINIGGEVPIPTTTIANDITTNSVTYRPAGIILRCTPRVNEPGIITVEVHTEVSNPSYVPELKAYRFQKRSADTVVRLKQGETMVIGGLINQDELKSMRAVPLLSKLPILGNLFKHREHSKQRTEVMLFLTARELL